MADGWRRLPTGRHLPRLGWRDDPHARADVARRVVVARVEELVAHVQHRLLVTWVVTWVVAWVATWSRGWSRGWSHGHVGGRVGGHMVTWVVTWVVAWV
eukprot:3992262-Prymnesium_polylepis.1